MSKRINLGLMTDLETVAMDSNAGLAQVGAVFYNVDTFEIVAQFCENTDWRKMVASGDFEKDENTLAWWKRQDKAVARSVFLNAKDPKTVAESFVKWVKEVSGGYPFELMSNHILFDLTKIDYFLNYYTGEKLTKMTKYNKIEDFATIRNRAKWKDPDLLKELEEEYTQLDQHNAVADCKWQVHSLACSLSILAGDSGSDDKNYYIVCSVENDAFTELTEPYETVEECLDFTGTAGTVILQINSDATTETLFYWGAGKWVADWN